MDDVRVLEQADHVEDAVDGLDVAQERVAEPGALRSALHEPRDVCDLQVRGHLTRRGVEVAEEVEALVGNFDARHGRVDGAERVVLGWHWHRAQEVEERRFTHIWQPDQPHLYHEELAPVLELSQWEHAPLYWAIR